MKTKMTKERRKDRRKEKKGRRWKRRKQNKMTDGVKVKRTEGRKNEE